MYFLAECATSVWVRLGDDILTPIEHIGGVLDDAGWLLDIAIIALVIGVYVRVVNWTIIGIIEGWKENN